MTAFVRQVRKLLHKTAAKRGKRLKLSVRVPWSVEKCLEIGLDVKAWKNEELIDMINISSYYCTSPELQIEAIKALPGSADIYGEVHFVTYQGSGELASNVNRRTTPEIYKTMAASYLERGADGISLFNFAYVRDHHFYEARRRKYMNFEPPLDILKNITELNNLNHQDIHYIITPGFGKLPQKLPAYEPLSFNIFIPCDPDERNYEKAVLRLELSKPGYIYNGLKAFINKVELEQIPGQGELFRPFSNEALPHPECLFFFSVPLNQLKHGWNPILIEASMADQYFALSLSDYQLKGVELAIYKKENY